MSPNEYSLNNTTLWPAMPAAAGVAVSAHDADWVAADNSPPGSREFALPYRAETATNFVIPASSESCRARSDDRRAAGRPVRVNDNCRSLLERVPNQVLL